MRRQAMFLGLGLAWALSLAACLPAADEDGGGGSVLGGWSQQLGTCQQRLAVAADGTFSYASRILLGGMARTSTVSGTYAGSPATGGDGVASLTVVPSAGSAGAASPYCAAWDAAPVQSLALTPLLSGMGLAAGELRLQPEYDPAHGVVWLATDTARRDRLALFQRTDGRVEGYSLDPAAVSPLALYHAHPLDLSTAPPVVGGIAPINMPGQVFEATVAQGTTQLEERLLVNVIAALDLSVSALPGNDLPVCDVFLYGEATFSSKGQQLTPGTPLEVNPFNEDFPFVEVSTPGDAGSDSAYLVALGIHSLAGSDCTVRLSAGYAAVRRAAAHGATPGTLPDLALPAQAGRHWAVPRSAADPAMTLLPWGAQGLARAGGVLSPWHVGLTADNAAAADVLGLAGGDHSEVSIAVGDAALSLVAGTGATAGPLTRYQPPAMLGQLPLPGSLDGSFSAGETAHSYRLTLPVAQRIEAHVEGALALRAELADADGALRAAASAGAPDGVGFGLAVTLPAGVYDLTVFSNGAVGAYRLVTSSGGTPLVPDAGLEQCLREAGAARSLPVTVKLADCAERGIAGLTGLGAYADIGILDLSGNRVGDLAPLAALTKLERLALDGNPVSSLSSLLGLPRLRRLSLGRVALPAAALSPLSALSDHLEVLNLTGNSALSEAEAASLKSALPHTLIVSPAGTLLD